jgi:hypothetical protein
VPLITPGFSSPVIVSYRCDDRSPFLRKAVSLAESLAQRQLP